MEISKRCYTAVLVLILVLMEDGLGPGVYNINGWEAGLNPCFNGRWSRPPGEVEDDYEWTSLNPCFNGRWSRTLVIYPSIMWS